MINKMINQAIYTLLTMYLSSMSMNALADDQQQKNKNKLAMPMQPTNVQGMEKCYGIAKSGMNDCGNASHGCAGEAKMNSDKQEWLFVPTGLCHKIVGGNLQNSESK